MLAVKKYVELSELIEEILSYNSNANVDKIKEAFDFAKDRHGEQLRKSGHPYYVHPLAVANIVASLRLDDSTIIAALLHDVLEDTDTSLSEIESKFGSDIANIVNGVTKLTQIEYRTEQTKQAENLKKLFLAVSSDIRVLIVKLCDRMHNMMTINSVTYVSQRKKAIETLEIFAPLAQRIGMYRLKNSLQDLAFSVINPNARFMILRRNKEIAENNYNGKSLFQTYFNDIQDCLISSCIHNASVAHRVKTPYSIWLKMKNKAMTLNQVTDIIGYRILTNNREDCYKALCAIHSKYKCIPGHFDDYISVPKENGYQSIHTIVFDEKTKNKIEIQIRTYEMEKEAEFGLAAHWSYKDGIQRINDEDLHPRWIGDIISILSSSYSSEQSLENTKLQMYSEKIFVFTPKGEIIHLATGATVLDFAFAIHSKVGFSFNGSKVNDVYHSSANFKLENGDKVEIINSHTNTVNKDWLQFVVTGKAKNEITKFIASQNAVCQDHFIKGAAILEKMLNEIGLECNDMTINLLAQFFGDNISNLYNKIYLEQIDIRTAIGKIFKGRFRVYENKTLHNQKSNFIYINNNRVLINSCCEDKIKTEQSGMMIFYPGFGTVMHSSDCFRIKNISFNNAICIIHEAKI